jgi:homoserine dehydrogenase
MNKTKFNVSLIGLGTVGVGVAKILTDNGAMIKARTGLTLNILHATDLDLDKDRGISFAQGVLHSDTDRAISDPNVDIGVELIGGTTHAGEITMTLLANGKHVVTANKALLAMRGNEIYDVARASGKCVAFEASCCGGIPLITSMRTGLAANNIGAMYGIANGTCNYILSSMSQEGKEYAIALAEAQEKGYAEADPTLDINGADTAHKLTILAAIAFGKNVEFSDIEYNGIEAVELVDINFGKELGYTLKLLAIAEQVGDAVSLRVTPAFVANNSHLAHVSGCINAMSIYGDAVGHTAYTGPGAGMMATASAVVADIIEVARGNSKVIFDSTPAFGRPAKKIKTISSADIINRHYLRLSVSNEPNVLSQITQILGDKGISIAACLQHESTQDEAYTPLVIVTHSATKSSMNEALKSITTLSFVSEKTICIDIITLPE